MNTLKYYLAENYLTPDPSDFMAQVNTSRSYTLDDVVKEMLRRGTSLTGTDVYAVLNLFHQVIGDVITEGYSINLPLCNGQPSISGVFSSPADSFDPNRHVLKYNLNPGLLIRDAIREIKTEKIDPTDKSPYIEQYIDVLSHTTNDVLTSKGIGEIQGSRIAFDATDEEQGIWLVATDGTATKVSTVAMNKPSKVIFMVPELAAGEYELLLKVKYPGSKTLRETTHRKLLTVSGGA
ncbi:DNA-binding domain-containing protein [Roseimarinus sediminis]|jgi:hypothetical protein|uniref:DNA-binding domain-containing protein n=1 Tax=Roseimarinus sediminis TaxID=1610899 RepID=UPI003D2129FF